MLRLTLLKIQSKATWLLLILLLILQITCLKSKYHNSQSQYNSFKLRKRSLEQQRRQDQQSIVSSSNHLQLYMPNAIQDEVPLFSPINISSYNQSASLKSEESPTTTKQLSSSSLPTITTTTTRLTNVNQGKFQLIRALPHNSVKRLIERVGIVFSTSSRIGND